MKRRYFISHCGQTCVGIIGIGALFTGCSSSIRYLTVSAPGNPITIPISDFVRKSGEKSSYYSAVIVQTASSKYPLVIYRREARRYEAFLLRCTHQGTELNVIGDLITCPAHGSQFLSTGEVIEGPATTALKTYTVNLENENLIVNLES